MEYKRKAYHVLVQPVLENTYKVWNPHTQQSIKQLETVQLDGFIALDLAVLILIGHHPHLKLTLTYIGLHPYLVV